MTNKFQSNTICFHALAIDGVEYHFVLPNPDMKQLKLNLYWDDTVYVGPPPSRSKDFGDLKVFFAPLSQLTTSKDNFYSELVRLGDYPPSTIKLQVPFELNVKTAVRKTPYNLTREKKLWLRQEFQGMLDSDIIPPSVSSFASPILSYRKEMVRFAFL